MNLLEYIKEKKLFDSIRIDDIQSNYKTVKDTLKKTNIEIDNNVINKFEEHIDTFNSAIDLGRKKLQDEFYSNIQPKAMSESYNVYDNRKFRVYKEIDNKEWDEELQNIILGQIKKYINFQYPGLEITPRSKIWTKNITGMDPLFIASKDLDVVDKVTSQFVPVYKRRIRVYHYEDTDFSLLPQNTFGFIFSWSYFEHLPYDIIDKYLANVYDLLLPGGTMLLSYADCLLEKTAKQFNNNNYCYMTKELLEGVANKNGLDLIEDHCYQFRNSWALLRKAGELPKGIKEVPSLGYVKRVLEDPIP